jgi:Fe-S-cluster-containing hydrogenase component 2
MTESPGYRGDRPIPSEFLRKLCLECGCDDVGFISIDDPAIADQRSLILQTFPKTRTLVSLVLRMNREAIRSSASSVANLEFHQTTDAVNAASRDIVRRLEDLGIAAMNPPAGFPMEMSRFPGKVWTVSHKPVAVAAGLGRMGLHRNVIHPRFGSFILLGTLLLGVEVDVLSRPIDFNPCVSCKLCVAACPVGAIKSDGRFDPSACMTHNYREFMSGFTDWVETVVNSASAPAYRRRVEDSETASMWQSLSFGANYKAAYCLAVCPAGEEVIPPFLRDRARHVEAHVRPLQQKSETVYVVAGSDAEAHVKKRFPTKIVKQVSGIRPTTIAGFLEGLPLVFQSGQASDLDAVYHFRFTGSETAEATVTIRNGRVDVTPGLNGTASCRVDADSQWWLKVLRKERSMLTAILLRRVRVKGGIRYLQAFGRCFPG